MASVVGGCGGWAHHVEELGVGGATDDHLDLLDGRAHLRERGGGDCILEYYVLGEQMAVLT